MAVSAYTHFDTYRCLACDHEWDARVTEDSGTREMAPESNAPGECPSCSSQEIRETDRSYDDPNAPDSDAD